MARLLLALPAQGPAADQLAIGQQRAVTSVSHQRAEDERAGLVAVELERSHQLDVRKLDDFEASEQGTRRLGKALHAHHARQHRRAVDSMIVEERLPGRVKLSPPSALKPVIWPVIGPPFSASAAVARSTSSPPVAWRCALRRPRDPATTTSPPSPAAVSSRRTIGAPTSGGSMSIPTGSITFGIEPRLAMPTCAHAVQSIAMPRVRPSRRRFETLLHSRPLAAE